MKLAFLLRFWPYYGGGETVTRVLTSEFLKRGHEVHVLYWWRNDQNRTYRPKGHYIECCIPVHSSGGAIPSGDISWLTDKLRRYINENEIDFVINQWWPAGITPKGTKAKIIMCWHTFLFRNILYEGNIVKYIYQKLRLRKNATLKKYIDPYYLESDALILLSRKYWEEFQKYSSAYKNQKKVFYQYNPLSYDYIPQIEKVKKKKEVLFVGRIEEPTKRISRILETWKIVNDRGINDWHLKIIGDGPDLENLKMMSKGMHLYNISFLGSKDPRDDYITASILLLTSAMEGWPITIVEGKNFGVVPLIMNTFSAAREIVNDGEDGVIVNSISIKKYASRLIDLMNDDGKRSFLSHNAIIDSKKYYVSRIVDSWMNLFAKISGGA